jgi:hypothetical protein
MMRCWDRALGYLLSCLKTTTRRATRRFAQARDRVLPVMHGGESHRGVERLGGHVTAGGS